MTKKEIEIRLRIYLNGKILPEGEDRGDKWAMLLSPFILALMQEKK